MRKTIGELLNYHFAGFGYHTVDWKDLSLDARSGWERHAKRLISGIGEDDRPVVEIFYAEFKGKGNPPNDFKKANEKLQLKWKKRVSCFFDDMVESVGQQNT